MRYAVLHNSKGGECTGRQSSALLPSTAAKCMLRNGYITVCLNRKGCEWWMRSAGRSGYFYCFALLPTLLISG